MRTMLRTLLLSLLFGAVLIPMEAEAKRDSTSMARKAERQRQKEERRRQEEIEQRAKPRFEGGDIERFERWVLANLRHDFGMLPPDVPHVRVEVPFYVEDDGRTTLTDEDFASKQLYPRLVQEIERVILFSPEWEPGHGPLGNPIRSRQELSITIKNHHYTAPASAPRPRPVRPAGRLRR